VLSAAGIFSRQVLQGVFKEASLVEQELSSRASFPIKKQISFCICPGCLDAKG